MADGLDPGTSYRIMLYASNKKGRSDATVIDPVTFGVAKLQGKFRRPIEITGRLIAFGVVYCYVFV